MEKLTIIHGVPGTNGVALVIADLGGGWGYGVAAGAVVALAQNSNLVVISGAFVYALPIGLVGVGGIALKIWDFGIAAELGVCGGARERWQRQGESSEKILWVHIGD